MFRRSDAAAGNPGCSVAATPPPRPGYAVAISARRRYGTPKCEFICQLAELPGGGYVGAHPSLGERAAQALLTRTSLLADVWAGDRASAVLDREVTGPRLCGDQSVRRPA